MASDEAAAPAGIVCRRLRVEGRVQGVGYREACVEQARSLGVAGWIRNRRDGSVEVLAQGTATAVARLQAWLNEGPALARVDRVTASVIDPAPPWPSDFERRPTE
jgi:acylphosphatase